MKNHKRTNPSRRKARRKKITLLRLVYHRLHVEGLRVKNAKIEVIFHLKKLEIIFHFKFFEIKSAKLVEQVLLRWFYCKKLF